MPDNAASIANGDIAVRRASGESPAAAVLVVDGNAFTRSCTVAGLADVDGFVVNGAATIDAADTVRPDIVLFQHHAGDALDQLAARLRGARRIWPPAILAVMSDAASAIAVAGVRSGAQIILPSEAGLDLVVTAIRMARAALTVLPIAALWPLRDAAEEASPDQRRTRPGDQPQLRREQLDKLTPRQRDVIAVLATGLSNKAIARRLGISESTVKVHIRAIMSATGVSNRTQLVARFLAAG